MTLNEAMTEAARQLDVHLKQALLDACNTAARKGATLSEIQQLCDSYGEQLRQWRAKSLAEIRENLGATLFGTHTLH